MDRPIWQTLIFGLVMTAIFGGLHYYLWVRLVRDPRLGPGWRRAARIALIALAVAMPFSVALSRFVPGPLGRLLFVPLYVWMGLVFLLVTLLALSELVRAPARAMLKVDDQAVNAGRRQFLARMAALAVAPGATGLGTRAVSSALDDVQVKRVRVSLDRWPSALDGFRIVQITDLHIGPTLGRRWLEAVVRQVNALRPDLIVITGDLVDGSVQGLRADVAPLSELRARHGAFFVTGNHEYYSGVGPWIAEVTRLGIRVLRNERVSIGTGAAAFDLAGIDDHSARAAGHGPDLARALTGRDPSREVILLAHQPRAIFEAARLGVGLQLSGHTHGGQIWPWMYFVRLQQPYVSGLARHDGRTQIYVSEGTGFWGPPMRLGSTSEITEILVSRTRA